MGLTVIAHVVRGGLKMGRLVPLPGEIGQEQSVFPNCLVPGVCHTPGS
jgi:hypothetical protein